MKTIYNAKLFFKRICKNLMIFLFISGAAFGSVSAQEMTPKLTDNEVRSVIPILKAEIAEYSRLNKEMRKERDAQQMLFENIKSGRTDPLEWLKQHSKYIIVPPGYVYEPACSRAYSVKGWDTPGMDDPEIKARPYVLPTAIFTFGKDFRAINKHLLGKKITDETYKKFRENTYNMNDPSYKYIRSILENTRSFYSKKGFSSTYSMSGDTIGFYPFDAEGEISGTVWQVKIDLYDPNNPDVVKNSRSLPMGPLIEISVGNRLMEKVLNPTDTRIGVDDENIIKQLKKAGITEERYGEIKAALMIARNDSLNPEPEEPSLPDFTPSTDEEKELVKDIEMMKRDFRIKKENIRIYKKYKRELDPILDVSQQSIGGF